MKVEAISNNNHVITPEASLNQIAKQRNVSIDELVASAKSVGSEGLPYQIRVLNLVSRLEKLK